MPTVDVQWPLALTFALERRSIDVVALARSVGLPDDTLHRRDARLAIDVYASLVERLSSQVDDPSFGLTVGSELYPELFGIVGQIAMHSETYGDALRAFDRYKRLVSPRRLDLEMCEEEVLVSLVGEGRSVPARIEIDAELSFLLSFGRRMTRTALRARAVLVTGPAPPHADRYREVFGCPATFMAERDALVLDAAALALPLKSGDEELLDLLRSHGEAKLRVAAAFSTGGQHSARVADALVRLLPQGEPQIGTVARRLGMSSRSLQRHLKQEETTFRAILDTTRRELAIHHLVQPELEPGEIALLLGFRHTPSFYRAFRRWTGSTPEAARHERRRGGALSS